MNNPFGSSSGGGFGAARSMQQGFGSQQQQAPQQQGFGGFGGQQQGFGGYGGQQMQNPFQQAPQQQGFGGYGGQQQGFGGFGGQQQGFGGFGGQQQYNPYQQMPQQQMGGYGGYGGYGGQQQYNPYQQMPQQQQYNPYQQQQYNPYQQQMQQPQQYNPYQQQMQQPQQYNPYQQMQQQQYNPYQQQMQQQGYGGRGGRGYGRQQAEMGMRQQQAEMGMRQQQADMARREITSKMQGPQPQPAPASDDGMARAAVMPRGWNGDDMQTYTSEGFGGGSNGMDMPQMSTSMEMPQPYQGITKSARNSGNNPRGYNGDLVPGDINNPQSMSTSMVMPRLNQSAIPWQDMASLSASPAMVGPPRPQQQALNNFSQPLAGVGPQPNFRYGDVGNSGGGGYGGPARYRSYENPVQKQLNPASYG